MSKTFVLIHGSWHGGWAWRDVIDHLVQKDCVAHAPTLSGHGNGNGVTRLGIAHKDCVNSVVTYIRQQNLRNIVLVGHSFGGTVVQKVAEQLDGRVSRIVFLDALILADGECVFDNLPPEYVTLFNNLAAASADNTMLIPWEIWRDHFMQDATEHFARFVWEQLTPEPNQVNLDRLELTRFYSLTTPKSFIYCRHDNALPPGSFHPKMTSRLAAFKMVEMDGSHEVMFSRPAELADKIIEASLE
jgi:pimeloyl-ACP methyl ester carboxylesterase